jgi:hypothetical protein
LLSLSSFLSHCRGLVAFVSSLSFCLCLVFLSLYLSVSLSLSLSYL